MNPKHFGQVIVLVLIAAQIALGARLTVSKSADDGGTYRTISSALKDAQEGDEVVILDFEEYEEQVTINKNRITLKSETPTLKQKPTIKYCDIQNVYPKTWNQSKAEDSINFDQNGALRVMRAQGVTIEGLIVDGGGAAPFGYAGVWNGKDALFHGNAALCLWIAGDVIVRNCEMQNAYLGISVKDRNEGGIFANANPADIAKWRVVPLSGFGKTGNHLIEHNRIHNNSWGVFFESVWDLASVIRYNLIYENHHQTEALAAKVKALPDGSNQPGGAMFFKDHLLSPLAVYNNTFWHNHVIFGGHWRAGAQHLIFNNIYAEPYVYWGKNPSFQDPFHALDPAFVYRMHHCLYAAQTEAPKTQSQEYTKGMTDPDTNAYVSAKVTFTAISQVRVMNSMANPEQTGQNVPIVLHFKNFDSTFYERANFVIQPGALIVSATADKAFPRSAEIRWLEPKFKSTDPTSAQFLVPDWDDPVMKDLIVDKGWEEAGIRDADGSIADIGAISFSGKRQETIVTIKPIEPVNIQGTTATAFFNLTAVSGQMTNPKIKYVKWINNLTFQADVFGGNAKPVPLAEILPVTPTISGGALQMGSNKITFTVPARDTTKRYAFLELTIEGEDADGNAVTSTVGFLPYRQLEYKFNVEVFNETGVQKLTEVRAGDIVMLRLTPVKVGDSKPFTWIIDTTEVSLTSSYTLYNENMEVLSTKRKVSTVQEYKVIFTKVPIGGLEYVSASGLFVSTIADTSQKPIMGTSDGIKVLPGDPDTVVFHQDVQVVNPGVSENVLLNVYDKYGNAVNTPVTVELTSLKPNVGDVDGLAQMNTDDTGAVIFKVKVTEGNEKDTFPMVATLKTNGKTDNAKMWVGKPRDKYHLFFSMGNLDPAAEINGCAGDRFPVTIIASPNGDSIATERTNKFAISFPGNETNLVAFASSDLSDVNPITESVLVDGKAVVWVTSVGAAVSGGEMFINGVEDNSVVKNSKSGISFNICAAEIRNTAYFTDNGNGAVDRLEIYYKDTLKSDEDLPDSIELYWPQKVDGDASAKRMILGTLTITRDPVQKNHITVRIPDAFDTAKTTFLNNNQLGITYWKNSATPEANVMVRPFMIADSVGPLLKTATLLERLDANGDDTMFVTFTENVLAENIKDSCLTLVKFDGTTEVTLKIISAVPFGGDTIRLVIANSADAPKYGDRLKILSVGSIKDDYGNKAHPDNRPVPILLRQVPANILTSAFYDKNADGFVETVTIKFNKNVIKEMLNVKVNWRGLGTSGLIEGEKITYLNEGDSTEVAVDITGSFNANDLEKIKKCTGGNYTMLITVSNKAFPEIREFEPLDKAAPVIVSAVLNPGKYTSKTTKDPDLLVITYSEQIKSELNEEKELFNFEQNSNNYSVVLTGMTQSNYEVTYRAKDFVQQGSVTYPVDNDLVNIKIEQIKDMFENYQNNADNVKVPLVVNPVPYDLTVVVKSNPFNPEIGEAATIVIDPRIPSLENVNIQADVKIFDQMGKVIFEMRTEPNAKEIKFKWDGKTKSGRKVGAGTYVAVVNAIDTNKDNDAKPVKNKKIYLGVKR